jgi:4-amino-4-deoxy-L-arabinose transferase-like glycosyltransferase
LSEREWREASDLRPSRFALVAVLIGAAFLRFWALGHGVPYALGVDEPEVMERATNMMRSGEFHPRFFDYPGLYIYAQFIVAVARFIAGAMTGDWTSLAQAPTSEFYVWGRALTATLGVATVFIVFQAGMRWGARHALLAAGLMAVQPQHVRESHYVLTDVPLTFFVALTLLLSLRAAERATTTAFIWAGVAAGLATATKYNGAWVLVVPLLACAMTPAVRARLLVTLTILGSALVTFLLAAPYTLLDLPAFLDTFARLSNEYRTSASPGAISQIYLKHLRNGFGYPALIMAGAGMVLGIVRLVRGPGRARWAMAIVFPLAYFWFVSRQGIVFARYLLPILPSLCLLAAAAVVSGVSLLRRYEIPRAPRTALIAGLTIAALLQPVLKAIDFNRMIARTSTAALAYDWVQKNVPNNAVIVLESRMLLLPNYPHADNGIQLRHRQYDDYVADKVDYLIASSASYGQYFASPEKFPREYAEYRRIFDQCQEVVRFTPSETHPGAELIIFKVRR